MRHIPKWLPGAGFKKEAAKVHKMVDHIRFASWEVVLDDMVGGFLNYGAVFWALTFTVQRAGAKHDSLARKLIDSNGPVDAVRDAVAFIYAGEWGAEVLDKAHLLVCVVDSWSRNG